MLIAMDPGTEKFGWAVSSDTGDLLLSGVLPIDEIDEWAKAVLRGDTSFLEERAVERSAARPDRSFPGFVIAGSGTEAQNASGDLPLQVSGLKRFRRASLRSGAGISTGGSILPGVSQACPERLACSPKGR
jgi:hypothetical protein